MGTQRLPCAGWLSGRRWPIPVLRLAGTWKRRNVWSSGFLDEGGSEKRKTGHIRPEQTLALLRLMVEAMREFGERRWGNGQVSTQRLSPVSTVMKTKVVETSSFLAGTSAALSSIQSLWFASFFSNRTNCPILEAVKFAMLIWPKKLSAELDRLFSPTLGVTSPSKTTHLWTQIMGAG